MLPYNVVRLEKKTSEEANNQGDHSKNRVPWMKKRSAPKITFEPPGLHDSPEGGLIGTAWLEAPQDQTITAIHLGLAQDFCKPY